MEKQKKFTYDYPMPAITTDTILARINEQNNKVEVLLIKRKNEPFKGQWALPGGYLEMDETIEDGAFRELEEETSIKFNERGRNRKEGYINLGNVGYRDAVDRDPRGRTISFIFMHIIFGDKFKAKAKDDAIEVKWFDINNLPDLAFDHKEIIETYKYLPQYELGHFDYSDIF